MDETSSPLMPQKQRIIETGVCPTVAASPINEYSLKSENYSYKKIRFLGQGGFGDVYLVGITPNDQPRGYFEGAMKIISKRKFPTELLSDSLKLESQILKESSNKFLIGLVESFEDELYYYLVMELACYGDLFACYQNFQ